MFTKQFGSCHEHEKCKSKWWKEFKFKTWNKLIKTKSQRLKLKTKKCARPKYKDIFIIMK